MTEFTKAVIYCRTACSPGLEKDVELRAQEQACRAYADNHGIEISAVFYDPGISGMSANRPGWKTMMEFLKHVPPYGVMIRDIMRWARDIYLSDKMEHECNRLGHKLIIADEDHPCNIESIVPNRMEEMWKKLKECLSKKYENHQL